ncbi:hypothetical protein FACS1894127_0550 [Clostridia bacterium]|nr:hypothetical protein FACS1894127_0550 [Clostridia bacterium]
MNTTTWNNYLAQTWDKYLPPIRPYGEEIEVFRTWIQDYVDCENRAPDILILGSTPELRDLVSEFKIIPTVVDFSSDNYFAMGTLRSTQTKEVFIESDWMELEEKSQFDLILSEAALNVVDAASSKTLYSKCNNFLRTGGKLFAKNWLRTTNKPYAVEYLIEASRSVPTFKFGFYSSVCIPLMLCFYDYCNEEIQLKAFRNCCKNLFDEGFITQCEWETIAVHKYEKVDLQLYIPSIFDFINDITDYFYIDQVCDVGIGFSEYHPMFKLTRR